MRLVILISLLLAATFEVKAHPVLDGLLSPKDARYPGFSAMLKWLDQNNPKVVVETGTARYGTRGCSDRFDGCSSVIFSKWARGRDVDFYSVDISAANIQQAKGAVHPDNRMHFIVSDSIPFLQNFASKIDLLYLDSFDFDGRNPGPSQRHHLYEITAAFDKLQPNSIVGLDDCRLVHGGKCTLVEQYLRDRHFIEVTVGYQKIFQSPLGPTIPVGVKPPGGIRKRPASRLPRYRPRKGRAHPRIR